MELKEQDLIEKYQSMKTDELIAIYKSGDLTDLAFKAIKSVIVKKNNER